MAKKGIALAYPYYGDLVVLGAGWFYTWGACSSSPICVPMSYAGEDPQLPADYSDYILLFNEPNNPPPFGGTLSPDEAVLLYMELVDKYPYAKFVVGNCNLFHRTWMQDFRNLCTDIMPVYWGFHVYITDPSEAEHIGLFLDGIHQWEFPGSWWITEFADVNGDVYNDAVVLSEFRKRDWIERWAYFTNRARGDEPWYPPGWNVQLLDWDTGELTEIGKWYASQKTYIPLIVK